METERRQTYSATARRFHWWTVAALTIMFPLGIAMTVRGNWLNVWDSATNAMYSTHKLLGVTVFILVSARLTYRVVHGAPADAPSIEPWQQRMSHVTHWVIYALLLTMPVVGWFGVQLYPALDLFGLVSLPAVVAPDKAASAWVLRLHGLMALMLLFLLSVHVAAALFHHLVRRDKVLERMLPGVSTMERK